MDNRFEETINCMLEQKIICETINPELFSYLNNESHRDEVDNFLHKIGRQTARTNDTRGFYCVFSNLDTKVKRSIAQRQFDNVTVNLEGLIGWLRLIRNVDSDSRPIDEGTRLNESELLAAIEESSALSTQLENIAHKFKKGGKSPETKVKLQNVMQYLTEQQYLQPIGSSGSVYIATAKWSLLYDQLEFIRSHEGYSEELNEEESASEEQKDMFHG